MGDCLDSLKTLPSESVQCCVTSPPYYGLRDYGTAKWQGGSASCNHCRDNKISESCDTGHANMKNEGVGDAIYKSVCKKCGAIRIDKQIGLEESPELYVSKLVAVFSEVKRVLKNDGVLWVNLGDSYHNYRPGAGQKQCKQTISGQRVSEVEVCHRRGNKFEGIKEKDLMGIPWRVAFALQADGWYLRQDIIWAKNNCMPESVTDRCTKSHEYIFLLSKNAKYFYDNQAISEPLLPDSIKRNQTGWSGNEDRGYVAGPQNHMSKYLGYDKAKTAETRNKRSVWTINPQPFKEAHFATFPPELPTICIKAGSREGDTVLDPFNGAGTTGIVCIKHRRNYIGCELNPEYIKISERRFEQVKEEFETPLFDNSEIKTINGDLFT